MTRKLLLISFISISNLFAQISGDNLIACYEFEGNTDDAIGGYHGTLLGSASVTTTLNTQGNNMDALSIPGNMINQVSKYTISMKVYFDEFNINSSSSGNCIFSGASASNDNLMNFVYVKNQQPGGSVTLTNMFYYIHDNVRYEFTNINLQPNTWYHVSLVRSEENVKLYLDGVIQSPINGHTVPTLNLTLDPNGFIFGQDQDVLAGGFDSNQSLNGSIDNLTVYDRDLNATEVDYLHTTTEGCRTLGVVNMPLDITSFNIFPNPLSNFFNIEINDNRLLGYSFDVIDMSGKIVYTGKIEENIQKVDNLILTSGVYLVKIQGSPLMRKIIIE